jgi:hypothetical protein
MPSARDDVELDKGADGPPSEDSSVAPNGLY